MAMFNHIRQFREMLKDRFGSDSGVRSAAHRAGVSERAWWAYGRGQAMPPADAAIAVARVLGVTVEQLPFHREGDAHVPYEFAESTILFPTAGMQCAGTLRAGAYINNCPMPGSLHRVRWSRRTRQDGPPDLRGAVLLGLCPLHEEQTAPWRKDDGPDLEALSTSLDHVTEAHAMWPEVADDLDRPPYWTNIGIPPRTRKFFKVKNIAKRRSRASGVERAMIGIAGCRGLLIMIPFLV
jgi:hypothetical protein